MGRTKSRTAAGDSQADRFIETARALGADKDEGALERVFGKVVPPVLPKANRPDPDKDKD